MTLTDAFALVGAALVSIGSGGGIVLLLSGWLGKVWANRIMEADRARHTQELEKLRSELRHTSERELTAMRTELDIFREKHLKGHSDKLQIYQLATNIVADFLSDFERIYATSQVPPDIGDRLDAFNRNRMRVYGYLAMLAPQPVIDAFDSLIDHLLAVRNAEKSYVFAEIRPLIIGVLNEIRKDIGIDVSPIEYRGKR